MRLQKMLLSCVAVWFFFFFFVFCFLMGNQFGSSKGFHLDGPFAKRFVHSGCTCTCCMPDSTGKNLLPALINAHTQPSSIAPETAWRNACMSASCNQSSQAIA